MLMNPYRCPDPGRLLGAALMCALLIPGLVSANDDEGVVDCLLEPNLIVDISSSEVGVLSAVHVDVSDKVNAGRLLAELDTQVERATLALSEARANAAAEVELLEQSSEFNSRRVARNNELHAKRAVPDQVMDEAQTELKLSDLRLRQALENRAIAKLELHRDKTALERRYIRSPIDGVVVLRHKSAGEYVEGDPIVQVAQLDPLRVQLVAPISMLTRIKLGMKATVRSELEDAPSGVATVTRIDPLVDAATATFGIRLLMPNPDFALPPGLKCSVEFHTSG